MNTRDLDRRTFLQASLGALGASALTGYAATAAAHQPNIVIILTDDQGWGDLGFNGNTNLATPNIDRLAEQGTVLSHFFVQPLCAPTRAELLTGRYYPRTGVHGVTRREEYMNLDETTLGDVFKAGGYSTGCFGKWHNGSPYPYHPNGRGFDEFYGFCCGHWGNYFDGTVEHNGEETHFEGYINDAFTEEAMRFIGKHQEQPFLCYVAYNTPHSPFQVPDRWYAKFSDKELAQRHRDPDKEEIDETRCVLAMCENLDWNVGRMVDCVDALNLTRDTIFVYFSDNGPNTWRWNGGMRGKKGFCDEGGVRSPCILTWPGVIPAAKQIPTIAGAIDLLPTLAGFAGIPLSEARLDGLDLKPLLNGDAANWPDRGLFAHAINNKFTSIRTQQYRAGGNAKGLFDMDADPGQEHDLAMELPGVYEALQNKINTWRRNVLPEKPPERFIPVGYRTFPLTVLNAQDGIVSGKIQWSSIHPNASFFENWQDTNDFVYWEIDVQEDGVYEATVLYTCPKEDIGAELQAVFKGESVSAILGKPFDPPLKNKQDRVARSESYEKEFMPCLLGEIRLQKGQGHFELRTVKKPGDGVCDVRAVRLRLVCTST